MTEPSHRKPALSGALSFVLPTPEQTLSLRACLYRGESGRQAWEVWRESLGQPKNVPIEGRRIAKSLRPLLLHAVRRNHVPIDKELLTYLRTAYLREQMRVRIYRQICGDVLSTLASEGIPAILLKGAALAETVYEDPALRHCHDIDLLLKDDDLLRAANVVSRLGFTESEEGPGHACDDIKLEHPSGLPLELHCRPFRMPFFNTMMAELWQRSRVQVVAEVPTLILSPADNLLHVCCHAFYSTSRASLLWAADSWSVIERYSHLDWDVLFECAQRSHLGLPLFITLRYLAEELNASIPRLVLDDLHAASSIDSVGREAALFEARSALRGFRSIARTCDSWRGRVLVAKWLLFPSPTYLRWVEQIQHAWLLPFYYMYRPLRYIVRRSRSEVRRMWPRRGKVAQVRQKGFSGINGGEGEVLPISRAPGGARHGPGKNKGVVSHELLTSLPRNK